MQKRAAPLATYAIALAFVVWGMCGLVFDVVMWASGVYQIGEMGLVLAGDVLSAWLIRIGVGVFLHRPYVLVELPWMLYLFVFLGGYLGAPGLSDTRRPGPTEYAITYSTLSVIAYGLYRYFQRPHVRALFEGGAEQTPATRSDDDGTPSSTGSEGIPDTPATTGEPEGGMPTDAAAGATPSADEPPSMADEPRDGNSPIPDE